MRSHVSTWPWQRESQKYWEMGWQRPYWIAVVLDNNFTTVILDGIIQILRTRLLLIIVSGGLFWLLKQIVGQGIPLWPGSWGFYEWIEILTERIGIWPLPEEGGTREVILRQKVRPGTEVCQWVELCKRFPLFGLWKQLCVVFMALSYFLLLSK